MLGFGASYIRDLTVISKKKIDDYYCPIDSKTVRFYRVSRHQCTQYFVSVLQCSVLSYHETKGMCMAHSEICVEMVQGTGRVFSSIMLYGSTKQECITWLSREGNLPDRERIVVMGDGKMYVGRLHHSDETLPGRLTAIKVKTVSLVNGPTTITENIDNPDVEYLVVSDTCSIIWVPYDTGNRMPSRAVVGGRKANGESFFVAALWVTNADMKSIYSYGYYDPETKLGYAALTGAQSNSTVNIMVENWST